MTLCIVSLYMSMVSWHVPFSNCKWNCIQLHFLKKFVLIFKPILVKKINIPLDFPKAHSILGQRILCNVLEYAMDMLAGAVVCVTEWRNEPEYIFMSKPVEPQSSTHLSYIVTDQSQFYISSVFNS